MHFWKEFFLKTTPTLTPKVIPDSTPCFTTCLTFLTWYMHFNIKSRGFIETTNLIDMSEIVSGGSLVYYSLLKFIFKNENHVLYHELQFNLIIKYIIIYLEHITAKNQRCQIKNKIVCVVSRDWWGRSWWS
jgi:hypothetical protein